MSELLERVAAEGQRKDREESKEFQDLDLSQINSDAAQSRVTCPRCEQLVVSEHFESHQTSHSSEILPWLFVGGKRNLENDKELTVRTGITHVLNLAQEVNIKKDILELLTDYNAHRGVEFVYKKIGLGDTPDQNILFEMDSALEFIHEARRSSEEHRVLVNCVQGISRSAAVVVAYLMKFESMSLHDAYYFLRRKRPIADPRQEFLIQLGELECRLFGLSKPSLQAEEVFAGRRLLDVDGAPAPVVQEDSQMPEMMHELEALQRVMQILSSQLHTIGAEADAVEQELALHSLQGAEIADNASAPGANEMAFVVKRYVEQLTAPHKPELKVIPELQQEQEACQALLDVMARAAATLLDRRDRVRGRSLGEGAAGPEGDVDVKRPII